MVVSEPRISLRYLDLGRQPLTPNPQPLTPDSLQPATGNRQAITDNCQPPSGNRPPHPMTERRQAALRAATLQAAWAHKRDRSVH